MKIRIPTKIRVRVSTLRWVGVLSILSMIALLFMFMSPITAYAYSDEDSEGQTQPTAATVVDASEDDEDDDDIVTPNITTPNSATPPSTARGSMTDEVQDGTGTVTENSDDAPSGKQFVTIETKSGKIFYMILDYDKAGDNVYLLTEVTESDLLNFVEVEDGGTGAAIPGDSTGATTPEIPEDKDPDGDTEPEPEPEPEPEKKSKVGTLLVILLIAGGGCGAYYYFKIKKPKSEPLGSLDDLDFEDDEDDGYLDDDGDDDFYLDDEPDGQGDDEE